jgi:hypothetical protein
VDDEQVMELIERLVAEEHRLLGGGDGAAGLGADDHARLERVRVTLDRAWDLLRQRRAREEFGLDASEATPRPAGTVEGYEQ